MAAARSLSIEREGGETVLSTARLNRVLEHEPGDLTAIVEAGIRLSELQAAIAPYGQMLALDPPGRPHDRRLPGRRTSPGRGATATARCATSSSA